jgi:hypothetical protein
MQVRLVTQGAAVLVVLVVLAAVHPLRQEKIPPALLVPVERVEQGEETVLVLTRLGPAILRLVPVEVVAEPVLAMGVLAVFSSPMVYGVQ